MWQDGGEDAPPGLSDLPTPQGAFSIRTTGAMRVRANNPEDGPERVPGGEVLTWRIGPRTTKAPTALIALARRGLARRNTAPAARMVRRRGRSFWLFRTPGALL